MPPAASLAATAPAQAPHAAARHRTVMLATMAVWGLNLPAMKVLLAANDPLVVSTTRMMLGALTLLVLLRGHARPALQLTRRQWLGVVACAFTMVYVNQMLLMAGMARSTATNASLLMAAGPLMTVLMAALAFAEPMTRRGSAGLALGFAGVAMVVLARPGASLGAAGLGDAMVVGAVAFYALGGILVQRLARQLAPETISLLVHGLGAAMLLAHLLAFRTAEAVQALHTMNAWLWTVTIFSSVFATALGNLIWHRAIARHGVAGTSLYVYWVPVFGVAFSVLLLGEPLTVWLLVGGAAVLAGTWLGTRRH